MAEETPQQLRTPAQPPPLAAHLMSDLVDGVRREVCEPPVLEVAPEQLHGVEFGRVGRKPDDVPAMMRGEPGSHEPVLRIADGDTVITTTVDAAGHDERNDQATAPGNPQTGPFFIIGAEPDDWVHSTNRGSK